ncbi:MAG TPA: ATP-dependent helicase, partial [Rectinemataceae bacterium]
EGQAGPYSLSDGGTPLRRRAGKAGDRGSTSLGELLETIAAESGLVEYHRSQDEFAGTQKLTNIEELVSAASLYPLAPEGLAEFLETIELDRSFQADDSAAGKDAVNLITMHNTKGLEFPLVIITGLEQGLFPRDDEEGEELEEQRRLFYVAATRAKDLLYLSACRWRRVRGRIFETSPSAFLAELDPALYELWPGGSNARRLGMRHPSPPLDTPRPAPRLPVQGARGSDHATPRAILSHDRRSMDPAPAQTSPGAPSALWKPGQAVYHDEYGPGRVLKSSETESSGPLVIVQFDTGKLAQFFPKYTRKLERLAE